MTIDEFAKRVLSSGVSVRFEAPLSEDELHVWLRDHPGVVLPADLLALLRRFNGVRFDLRGGDDGYFALLPLARYRTARNALYGEHVDDDEANAYFREDWPDHRLAISHHADGTYLIALDTAEGTFWDADAYDSPRQISSTVEGLLDWIDQHWLGALASKAN